MTTERTHAISPLYGQHIVDRDELSPQGFDDTELHALYADLLDSRHNYGMAMESPDFWEVDDFFNPGVEEVPQDFVLEAIVVDKFSKTERRMAAVVRVFNRHLSGQNISALSPIIGEPRKTGSFAYVTVQIPFSDGQVISVVFHSPEGDKKRIAPDDTIIAFRWLLNKRDITQAVAPEDGSEVSLETIGKRITQLVVKNSARFERSQKEAAAERKALEEAQEAVRIAEERERELMDQIAKTAEEAATIEAKLSNTLALLEKQKTINAELSAKIDALRKISLVSKPFGSGESQPVLTLQKTESKFYNDTIDKVNILFAKAKEKGLSPRTPAEFMAEIENKNRIGFSLTYLKQQLEESEGLLSKLNEGSIHPSAILGKGGTKKEAITYIEKEITNYKRSILSGGIGDTVNLGNYAYYLSELVNKGQDTGFITDAEREQREREEEELQRQRDAEEKALAARAEQFKRYEVGNEAGMISPVQIKYTIQSPSDMFLVKLGEAATPNEKYKILKSAEGTNVAKRVPLQTNLEFDMARALRKEVPFGYFHLSPRRGYYVATLTIDTAAEPPQASSASASYIRTLKDIVDGKYDNDSGKVLELLEAAINEAEEDGKLEELQDVLDAASNHLTDLLSKEAA